MKGKSPDMNKRRLGPVALGAAVITLGLCAQVFIRGALSPTSGPRQAVVSAPAAAPSASLPPLLAKAADYCRRLEASAFDFVCREEIFETIDPNLDLDRRTPPINPNQTEFLGPAITISRARKVKSSYVYGYQCVRAGRTIREVRTQLEENGKRKVVPNAELRTSVVDWGTALLAPVGIFGERLQADYDFTIARNERVGATAVLVIDAKPKPGAPSSRNLYGKAWVDPATGDILKIEWSERRVGRFDVFEKRGQLYKRTPRLVIRSEFSAEKNGIRFPSRLTVEEAYLKDSGKAFVRSKTDVVYRDFKFFTVEVEVRD
jgi:hypothetical protein